MSKKCIYLGTCPHGDEDSATCKDLVDPNYCGTRRNIDSGMIPIAPVKRTYSKLINSLLR
jgi:hypothetical protein